MKLELNVEQPSAEACRHIFKGSLHFGASGYEFRSAAVSREMNAVGNFLDVVIAEFFFTVNLREVVDVEFTVCNQFDSGFIDPGPTGENIEGMGITWIQISIHGSTLCLYLVKAIHELRKGVVDRGPDREVAVFH